MYYVSDHLGGLANIVKLEFDSERGELLPAKPGPQMVTSHKDESVRRARMNSSGDTIVYECGPDIWIRSVKDGKVASSTSRSTQTTKQTRKS